MSVLPTLERTKALSNQRGIKLQYFIRANPASTVNDYLTQCNLISMYRTVIENRAGMRGTQTCGVPRTRTNALVKIQLLLTLNSVGFWSADGWLGLVHELICDQSIHRSDLRILINHFSSPLHIEILREIAGFCTCWHSFTSPNTFRLRKDLHQCLDVCIFCSETHNRFEINIMINRN